MSFHAQRFGRLRAMATVSLALTTAALSVAIGATPALAFTGGDHPAPPEDGPGDSRPGDNYPEEPNPGTGTIRGRVWIDVNKNGVQDPDEHKGVEGSKITVKVVVKVPEGTPSKTIEVSAVAGQQGKYTVPELPVGEATVTVLPPVADGQWRFSPVAAGGDRAKDNDFAEVKSGTEGQLYTGVLEKLKIRAGQNPPPNRDAGVYLEPKPDPKPTDEGVISGRVWNDVDRDGIQNEGENGVANLPVLVLEKKDCVFSKSADRRKGAVKSARPGKARATDDEIPVTDAQGNYEFTGLPAGKYCVVVAAGPIKNDIPVKEWTFSPKDQGDDDSIDSDVKAVTEKGFDGEFAVSSIVKLQKCKGGDKKKIDAGVYKKAAEPTPTPTPTPSPTATAPPVPSEGGGSLPVTGAAVGGFLAAGALLIGGGVALTVLGRRRRKNVA